MDRLIDAILSRVVERGSLSVVTARGRTHKYGDGTGTPVAVRFTTRGWQLAVALDPELRLGEAYHGWRGLVVEQGSITDFLDIVVNNVSPIASSRLLKAMRWLMRRMFQRKYIVQSSA